MSTSQLNTAARLNCYFLLLLVICVCALSPRLEARDRPGTPNRIWVSALTPIDGPPMVVAQFYNTASEEVNFWVDWTVNGQQASNEELWTVAQCAQGWVHRYVSCTGFMINVEKPPLSVLRETYTESGELERDKTKAFRILNVPYNTRYCFRFKARKKSNGVVSENWSEWGCASTIGPPARPPAPRKPDVIYYPSNELCAVRNGPALPCVVIKWGPGINSPLLLNYLVQFRSGDTGNWQEARSVISEYGYSGYVAKNKVEFVMAFDQRPPAFEDRYAFRVCSTNISGNSCSPSQLMMPGISKNTKDVASNYAVPVPIFDRPSNGATLPPSDLDAVLRIMPIKGFDNTTVEVEMTNLTSKAVKKYQVTVATLMKGMPLTQLTPIGGGHFQARVHVLFPHEGQWSYPITFTLQTSVPARKAIVKH